ncbi:MAG TPA: type II toxin-antitoxin system YafQ family toxin [Caldilineae bacterium]|nr:type II toxin-antitoxin system YafQ family toxin [Caldilineae bacterium]
MRTIRYTSSFKKDFKRVKKRGENIDHLKTIITLLAQGEPLPESCRDHKLSGGYSGLRECHLEPDWLLVYRYDGESELILTRTGTHSDLFK